MVALAVVGVSSNAPNYWSESGTVAQNLISGRGYTFNFYGLRQAQPLQSFMPPLFIWLLYACLHFSTQPALALAAVHAVLSSLTAVAIFLLAAQLSGRKSVALLSGLAAAGYPVMVLMITIPISLTLHLAVLAWALVFTALLAPRPNWLLALVTGTTWGVLALGRPAIVAFLPLVLLWLWWNRRTRQDWLQEEVATISEVDLDRRQFQAGLAFIRQQPKEWLALMSEKAVGFLWFRQGIGALYDAKWTAYYRPLYVILLILTIAGLAISTRRWRQYSLLYLLFVFYTAIHVFYNVQTRFRWEIEPFFLIFAALCLVEVYDRVSSAVLADADRLDPHAPDRV